ncbi:Retrovirus-related Pol polyprotein from transposon 17.6 [Exaiptasia diaphana]|nr:Retrovirus-related Pol polyprotein from transposon 17.6 [Exaiptasia diaphana]
MAQAQVGTIEPFDGDDFSDYSERLDSYLFANNIGKVAADANEDTKKEADRQKVATTISVIGKKAYKVLKDLCLPEKPTDKSYKQLTEILTNFYKPKVLEVAESYRFHHTIQGENESVTEYANKLKRLAVHCNFGPYLTRALRDQFVGGVRGQSTKKKLLSEDRTFEQALKVAQADELAEKESKLLYTNTESIDVNQPVHACTASNLKSKAQPVSTTFNTSGKKCFRCDSTQHLADKCSYVNATCYSCNKKGHLSKACFKRKKESEPKAQTNLVTTTTIEVQDQENFQNPQTVYMHSVNTSANTSLYKLTVNIEDANVKMEIDTGSAVTLLNTSDFKKVGGSISTLKPSTVVLKGYTGNTIKCLGEKEMSLRVGDQVHDLTIRVVDGPSLLGRDMMSKFTLPWHNIFNVVSITSDDIVQQYSTLFDNTSVGKLKDVQVSLKVDDSNPVFLKPRVVGFSVRDDYEIALDKLEKEGIIERVEHSDWASPTVPVKKPDGSIRICGDYSGTINKFATLEQYPVPTFEELQSTMSGGMKYTKLDLSQAYHQLELTPESRKYTTINTHKGLYQYKRLTFGINSAVSIFQRTIENALKGLPGCCVYIDDILITGETDEIHLQNLHKVLQRLQDLGLKLKKDKFHFMMDEIVYLGFSISAAGVAPTKEKVDAIRQAPPPSNVAELQSFIGSANFLRKFVSDFANIMHPLYQLLKKGTTWRWGSQEQSAFAQIKEAMCSDTVLRHYDPAAELILQCDASSIGIGAALLQPGQDGELQPVAYASRTLSQAEQNYSQIERESLAIVFGITKFRQYLLGRHFKLLTDHKPLIILLGEHKPVPQLASARIKRWALL